MEDIYNQLREDITFGKFKPGEHLSERFLTQEYGVSRASIREIISQLASQGYLTVKPNRGAIVTKLSLQDIDVIYNILLRCESFAAGLFAKRKNGASIDQLKQFHTKMQMKGIKLKYKLWLELNDQFHKVIYMGCRNNILSDLVHHTRLRIHRFRLVQTDLQNINSYNRQHGEILSAISKGAAKQTEKLMTSHLKGARKHRMEKFREFADWLL